MTRLLSLLSGTLLVAALTPLAAATERSVERSVERSTERSVENSVKSSVESSAALLQRLQRELTDGRLAEALLTARRASDVVPNNMGLWYNLAGLEQQQGDLAAAIAAFSRAVDLGFDDFRHADQDADLGNLRRDPVYRELRDRWQRNLAGLAAARAQQLAVGQWSDTIVLPDTQSLDSPPAVAIRLLPGETALEVEAEVDGAGLTAHPPWRGGSGLLVTIVLPDPAHPAEGTLHLEVAIGLADDLPAGAVRLGDRWQRVAELTPKLHGDDGSGRWRFWFTIPWTLGGALHPLVDSPLGVNLTYLRRGGELPPARVAWLADPAAGRSDRPWRRGVPVRWQWPATAAPAVQGRPVDLVVRDGVVAFAPLAVVAPDTRPADVELVLRDNTGSIASQASLQVDGPAGYRQQAATLDVRDVAPGSARLGASYIAPGSGELSVWDAELVILPRGWEADAKRRIATAPAAEQPSLQHRLQAIEQAIAGRHPRELPGALGTTVDELQALLDRVERLGTSLAAGSTYLAVMPGTAAEPGLRCSLYLPDDWRRGDPWRTLLLLAVTTGAEQRAVALVPRLLAERAGEADAPPPSIVMAVPHLGELSPADVDTALIGRLMAWLQDFAGSGRFHLAGVDLQAATVLELAAGRPGDLAGILMLTGLNFVPYPGASSRELADRVAGLDPALRAGWYWFPDEQVRGDQAAALRRGLRAAGLELSPARAVAGGLDFTQAWMRALLWAVQQDP